MDIWINYSNDDLTKNVNKRLVNSRHLGLISSLYSCSPGTGWAVGAMNCPGKLQCSRVVNITLHKVPSVLTTVVILAAPWMCSKYNSFDCWRNGAIVDHDKPASDTFTKPPLFQKNRLTSGNNPISKVLLEGSWTGYPNWKYRGMFGVNNIFLKPDLRLKPCSMVIELLWIQT